MPQSSILGDTGNGSTISFATGISAALKVRFIDPSALSIGRIDVSDISTTGVRRFIPEDLADAQTIQIEAIWDTFFTMPIPGTVLGNVTITFPLRTGETTPQTMIAKGHIQTVKPPRLENNVLQVIQLTIQLEESIAHTKST